MLIGFDIIDDQILVHVTIMKIMESSGEDLSVDTPLR